MDNQYGRYAAYTARLIESVLSPTGQTATELRRALLLSSPPVPLSPSLRSGRALRERGDNRELTPALAAYVDKVALHAYKVTDEDVAALQRAGHSDDALFELTVAAAVGAALGRLERGLAALRES